MQQRARTQLQLSIPGSARRIASHKATQQDALLHSTQHSTCVSDWVRRWRTRDLRLFFKRHRVQDSFVRACRRGTSVGGGPKRPCQSSYTATIGSFTSLGAGHGQGGWCQSTKPHACIRHPLPPAAGRTWPPCANESLRSEGCSSPQSTPSPCRLRVEVSTLRQCSQRGQLCGGACRGRSPQQQQQPLRSRVMLDGAGTWTALARGTAAAHTARPPALAASSPPLTCHATLPFWGALGAEVRACSTGGGRPGRARAAQQRRVAASPSCPLVSHPVSLLRPPTTSSTPLISDSRAGSRPGSPPPNPSPNAAAPPGRPPLPLAP
jgi:hypothetical protein